MNKITSVVAIAIALFCLHQRSVADVNISTPIGSGVWNIIENRIVDGERQISIYAAPAFYREIVITAYSGTEPIRYVRIESDAISGEVVSAVGLHVVEDGGTISHITEISKDSGSTANSGFRRSMFRDRLVCTAPCKAALWGQIV